jgi:hypothetical protein
VSKLRGPEDVEALWHAAVPLAALPAWLGAEDRSLYRQLAKPDEETLQSWLDRGFICEGDTVYIPKPKAEAVWSIGLWGGPSLTTLKPLSDQPILSRETFAGQGVSYVADPFLLRRGGEWHLFFEAWNWHRYQGEIAHAVSTDHGRTWTPTGTVLREVFHLSYPQVFDHAGHTWMIPESHEAGGVRLYRCTKFPDEWQFEMTLIEAPYLADATVTHWNGMWYLLADASPTQPHDTLRLWVADNLHGPWQEHPGSPLIINDPRHARPAGRIILDDGKLIRFAQSAVPEYGTDVRAFVIDELTPTTYRERPLSASPILGPGAGWHAGGMHHLDVFRGYDDQWLAVVDGWLLR